eukprot:NODE_5777_length_612_cov_19.276289_g5613_i0.p1 GENE.NODE_5777_length_612_cov_19.276289_g5613_i0~~NODE_5777_length_612_cov_19.276289_g5613_i0.p1  ORF type:complete len:145 (-),score=44.90 NODE_5777_length_612_cov_19.276289_g5613_i0:61-495(-)
MLQMVRNVITNPYDRTKIKILFCNKTEDDILLKDELDRLHFEYPDQVEVTHVLSKPGPEWTGETGHITHDLIRKYMPSPESATKVWVCGPAGFYTTICGPDSLNPYWTTTNTIRQPGATFLDTQMDSDSMLAEVGYGQHQVEVL